MIIAVNAKKTYLPATLNPKTGKKEGGGPCFLGIECIFDDVHSKLKEFPLVDIDGKKKQPRGHKVWWSPKTGKYSLHNPHQPVLNPETVKKDTAGKPIPGTEDVLWGMNGLPLAKESTPAQRNKSSPPPCNQDKSQHIRTHQGVAGHKRNTHEGAVGAWKKHHRNTTWRSQKRRT